MGAGGATSCVRLRAAACTAHGLHRAHGCLGRPSRRSPLGEKLPFFGPWYGSEPVLEQWVHHISGEPGPDSAAAAAQGAQRVVLPS